jgi:FkbM family methyltransferase
MNNLNILDKVFIRVNRFILNWKIKNSPNGCFEHKISSGDKFALSNDEISVSLYVYDNFENTNRKFWDDLIKPGMTVFDIGANWGVYSVAAKRLLGSDGNLVSFEPNKNEYSKLNKNLSLNKGGMSHVTLVNSAVGDSDGSAIFYMPPEYKGAYGSLGRPKIDEDCEAIEVKITKLDSYINENSISALDVIKIDVEGAEIKVLTGAIETLKKFSPVILMEVSDKRTIVFGYKARELCDFLLDIGYKLYLPRVTEKGDVTLEDYIPEDYIKYVDIVAKK